MAKPQIRWTPHRDPYKKAAAALSASYMSNAKWHKTLQAIAKAQLGLTRATWKFIGSDRLFEYGVPDLRDLLTNSLVDGRFQPVEYKWIEWIRFPRTWRPIANVGHELAQDVEALLKVLECVGKLQMRVDDKAVTIYGYGS